MKKIYTLALASVAVVSVVASCAKLEDGLAPEVPGEGELITITATIPDDGITKVSFDQQANAGAIKLYWETGDQITVTDAANPSNISTFTLSSGAGTMTGTFTGTPLSGSPSSFNISYDATDDVTYANQHQAADESTAHLRYSATLTGVNKYSNFIFSQNWASANGGSFNSSSVLRLRTKLPPALVGHVKAVTLKADAAIFNGATEMKVSVSNMADVGESGVLTVYASLPAGVTAIPAGTKLCVQYKVSDANIYTAFRTFTSAVNLQAGKVNALDFNCPDALKLIYGAGTSDSPYLLDSKDKMVAMPCLMKAGETIYFKMTANVDLEGVAWEPLNSASPYDKGIYFDGDHHTISHLTPVNTKGYPSFAGVAYGTYKDVTFDHAVVNAGNNNAGVFAGYIGTGDDISATCSGITVSNSTVTGIATQQTRCTGMFAGKIGNASSSVSDCHVTGTNQVQQLQATYYKGCSVGGFIGEVSKPVTITNCTAKANVSNPSSYYTGGFVGQVGEGGATAFINCAFLGGTISTDRNAENSPVGGFIGRIAANLGVTCTGCYVTDAAISASASGRIGGFVGDAGSGATPNTFTSCYVKNSSVSGGINTGGFVGTYGTASKCHVETTTVTANANDAGGFIGYLENGTVTNCYAAATVVGGAHANVGGFVGVCRVGANIPAQVTYSYTNSTVSGTADSVGAFIGGVTAVPNSVTKCIAWDGTHSFVGSAGSLDISSAITGNYCGTSGTISSQATDLGWDTSVWNLSASTPTLK